MRLETYFSFPNISENNNAVNISINDTLHEIKIPTGCYEIDSINMILQKQHLTVTGEKKAEQHVVFSANNK